MKHDLASKGNRSRCDQIRRLGFDPSHLTPAEQEELLEREARLAGGAGGTAYPPPKADRDPRLSAVLSLR